MLPVSTSRSFSILNAENRDATDGKEIALISKSPLPFEGVMESQVAMCLLKKTVAVFGTLCLQTTLIRNSEMPLFDNADFL
jgi:hypothetical protein